MKIIEPSVTIEPQNWGELLKRIEKKARVCYKSEEHITDDSSEAFIKSLIKRGHLSVLEHEKISVKFTVDRGISHEIVRHRLASYSQESTRYCNYNQSNEITVINPFFFRAYTVERDEWRNAMKRAETCYFALLNLGATPQQARSILPNSLKTELWMTANLREWMHFFNMRCAPAAHPQMRQVAIPLLLEFKRLMPAVFDHIPFDEAFSMIDYAEVICEEEPVPNKTPYLDSIIKRFEAQTEKGIGKYGATLDQNPKKLTPEEIVEYALEEITDLTVYLEKVKRDISGR